MRKILFASERLNATSTETFYFISLLVLLASLASTIVLYFGLKDDSRNHFKLVLHCIMIITSVIPPELPMELSLAVTTSLAALGKQLVYCTEPFRIPFAGRVSVVCFDKTGTLTKDKLELLGVVVLTRERVGEGEGGDEEGGRRVEGSFFSLWEQLQQHHDVVTEAVSRQKSSSSTSSTSSSAVVSVSADVIMTTVSGREKEKERDRGYLQAEVCSDVVLAVMAGCHSLILGSPSDPTSLIGIIHVYNALVNVKFYFYFCELLS